MQALPHSLLGLNTLEAPYDFFAEWREKAPVLRGAEGFAVTRYADVWRLIGDLVDDALEPMLDGEERDLVDALAFPLPSAVICELLAIPQADRDEVRRRTASAGAGDNAAADAAITWLRDYMSEVLAEFPDEQQRLWDNPDLTPSAVEEFLRYDAPVRFSPRVAVADVVFRRLATRVKRIELAATPVRSTGGLGTYAAVPVRLPAC